jgi:hypothetical protein
MSGPRHFCSSFPTKVKPDERAIVALIVLCLLVVGICWWASGFSTRSRNSYNLYRQTVAEQQHREEERESLYQRGLDLAEEGNRLRAEEIALLRELIAALREKR